MGTAFVHRNESGGMGKVQRQARQFGNTHMERRQEAERNAVKNWGGQSREEAGDAARWS